MTRVAGDALRRQRRFAQHPLPPAEGELAHERLAVDEHPDVPVAVIDLAVVGTEQPGGSAQP